VTEYLRKTYGNAWRHCDCERDADVCPEDCGHFAFWKAQMDRLLAKSMRQTGVSEGA